MKTLPVTLERNADDGEIIVNIGGFCKLPASSCFTLALQLLKKVDPRDEARLRFIADMKLLSESDEDAEFSKSAISA